MPLDEKARLFTVKTRTLKVGGGRRVCVQRDEKTRLFTITNETWKVCVGCVCGGGGGSRNKTKQKKGIKKLEPDRDCFRQLFNS